MGKRKEVIDLTNDEDEPTLKRVRCETPQLDNAEAKQEHIAHSTATFDPIDEDERIARELQAQYDLESSDTTHQPPASGDNDGPKYDTSLIHNYVQDIKKIGCTTCRKRFLTEEKDVPIVFKQWLPEREHGQNAFKQFISGGSPQASFNEVKSVITCPRKLCFAATCMGCGMKCSTNNKAVVEGVRELTWCCDRGRLFLIWALLCGYDRRQTNLSVRARPSSSKSKAPSNGGQANGIGYESGFPWKPWKSYGIKAHVDPEDGVTQRIMSCLTALLPSLTSETPTNFDLEPPAVLQSILLHSKLLKKAAELLRNDSLEDATQRFSLYRAVLKFVERLGSHPSTASTTIHDERPELEQGEDLLQLSFPVGHAASRKNKTRETTQSLATCLAGFDRQSKLVLNHSKTAPDYVQSKDSRDLLSLCRLVSELSDFLLANSDRSPISNTAHELSMSRAKEDWHSTLTILELPDCDIMNSHCFAGDASKIVKPPLGRMKALGLELARLTTGLPPGIFIRHCSTRIDVMKVLVIGPKGTPYENGLFEFDLLCGNNFPNEPPKMTFKTTGGGQIRFNPNLYATGHVCLSLLGTWSGEPWQPGSSTILQVLLSIQAMIFCEEPWYNEPGREGGAENQKSREYNQKIRGRTVQYAMVEWLNQLEEDGIWSDVILQHFRTSASEILARVDEWGTDGHWRRKLREGLTRIPGAVGEMA